MKHLEDVAIEKLNLSKAEKINYIGERMWIPYTRADKILNKFTGLLNHPKIARMPNYFLYGDSNNGKTELLIEFDKRFEPFVVPKKGTKLNVLMIETPPKGHEGRLYSEILYKLNVAHSDSASPGKKFYQVRQVLSALELKILIIDELHNVITAPLNKQREFLTLLKSLANELQIVIIASGTNDARRVINTDDQLANRFEPIELPKWELNEDFLRLLISFEGKIPLKEPSVLASSELAVKIYDLSEGLLGEVSKIVKESAKLAIEKGDDSITLKTIESIDYKSPSIRRKG